MTSRQNTCHLLQRRADCKNGYTFCCLNPWQTATQSFKNATKQWTQRKKTSSEKEENLLLKISTTNHMLALELLTVKENMKLVVGTIRKIYCITMVIYGLFRISFVCWQKLSTRILPVFSARTAQEIDYHLHFNNIRTEKVLYSISGSRSVTL